MDELSHVAEAASEVLRLYVSVLLQNALPFVAWLAALTLLASKRGQVWYEARPRRERIALACLLVATSLFLVSRQVSLFDDAHISLRYADNLVRGHGLVWNPGERVEGYTNFLWTVLLAGCMAVGLDGERVALALTVLCFVGELALVFRLSAMLRVPGVAPRPPWAVLFLGGSVLFTAYGTTGMETMFAALLVTGSVERALHGRWFAAGSLGVAAILAHPDHVLFYAGLGFVLLLDRGQRRQLLWYAAPFVLIYVPYFIARWRYYGDFFPNTYYVKSGGALYLSQGLIYLITSVLALGLVALGPLALIGWFRTPSTLLRRFWLFACLPYVAYVCKVGGDFMLGRLLISVLPFAALLAAQGFDAVLERSRTWATGAAVFCLAVACTPAQFIERGKVVRGIANESDWYRVSDISPVTVESPYGGRLAMLQRMIDAGMQPLVAERYVGLIGYKTRLPIVDIHGLTDRYVAHLPIRQRGRPGHEKTADARYLLDRKVQLSAMPLYPRRYERMTCVKHESTCLHLARFDSTFAARLRGLGFTVLDPRGGIDELLGRADQEPLETIEADFSFFQSYYFSGNQDPQRHDRFVAALARRRSPGNGAPPTSSVDSPLR